MLTIGEFSRICFVTKKTLRHYDQIGLLRPEHTAENGYRFYTVEQLRTMLLISRLKNYGLSLPEIAAVLADPDEEKLASRLQEKRLQLEKELRDAQRVLAQMDEDIDRLKRREDIMDQNIVVKTAELPPQKIFGMRQRLNVKHFPEAIGQLFQRIEQRGLNATGPLMFIYHEEEFVPESSDIELAVAVNQDGEEIREMAGGLHCFATLVGPYNPQAFTATYAALSKWIADNGYRMNGAPFDKYVRGGPGVPPEEYVTEIYFHIDK